MESFCKIKFLGTGEPMTIKQFNTCMAFLDQNNECFLIDTGGGNGILKRLADEDIKITKVKNIFITHSHTDHILGALWLIREIARIKEDYKCNFYMAESVYKDLMTLCSVCISGHMKKAEEHIKFNIVNNLDDVIIGNNKVTFFDTYSKKIPQFGCIIEIENKRIGFCGDIPLEIENYKILKNIDILIHESLCDSNNSNKYNVYDRGHITAKDAGRIAKELNANELILIHKVDEYVKNDILKIDAIQEFTGNILVPEDGQILKLDY